MHAFIVGGTGQIGHAAAASLLDHGFEVTLAHRGQQKASAELVERGCRQAMVDRNVPGALAQALGGGADVVIDAAAYDSTHADQLLELQGSVGSYIVISSASVYRDEDGKTFDEAPMNGFPAMPEPITEMQPTVAPGPATYSTRKAALERRLLDGARRPVTVLRPCAIYGPCTKHPREWWFVKRALDGREAIPLAYGGASRFHTSSVHNIAALMRATTLKAATQVLNAVDPYAPSVAEIGTAILDRLGSKAELVLVSDPTFPPRIGATPWSVPRPFVLSDQASRAAGYVPVTTYHDAIGELCEWLVQAAEGRDWREAFPGLAAYPWNLFDYEAEDAFLAS
jgi:nucleoside-diphosphate-sugar epimerase